MYENLTSREFRLVFFFIRYCQGYQIKERIIQTKMILDKTGLPKQKAIPALKSLIRKGIIERTSTGNAGEYIYNFNEFRLYRTHATSKIKLDPKVTDLGTYKQARGTQIGYLEVPKSGTSRNRTHAPKAAAQPSKYRFKYIKILNKEKKPKIKESFTLSDSEIIRRNQEKFERQRKEMGV